MEKEFVPYTESLALKEIGFDEECLGYYFNKQLSFGAKTSYGEVVEAPLYQQAFDWFEKTHSIFVQRMIDTNVNEIMDITYTIKSWKFPPIEIKFENSYDCFDKNKSELACLKELIELVKQKQ